MKNLYRLIALFAFIPLINGCGGSGGNDDQTNPTPNPGGSTPAISHALLNGTWLSTCDGSAILEFIFLNGDITVNEKEYTDANCTLGETTTLADTASYNFGRDDVPLNGSTASLTTATGIDYNIAPGGQDVLVDFDIIAIAADATTLYQGNSSNPNDGSTDALRPMQLNGAFPLTKQ